MNKEEIQSLLKEYEPIGNSDTEKLINLLNIWIKEGHLLLNESNRQDELYKILEAILSSIPTHKDETKTHDIFCATNYFKDVHRGIKFTHCTCLEQSVPQPLKPLSDITDEDAMEFAIITDISYSMEEDSDAELDLYGLRTYLTDKTGYFSENYDVTTTIRAISFLQSKGYKLPIEFSLPVDNTVSEVTKDIHDLNKELIESNELLTSQLSLYKDVEFIKNHAVLFLEWATEKSPYTYSIQDDIWFNPEFEPDDRVSKISKELYELFSQTLKQE